jgi:Fe-S-cluster-containing hydrogenase component 2
LLSWLMFGGDKESVYGEVQGLGRAHHHDDGGHGAPKAVKKAVKCDMCKGQDGGPACVRACPTGAALRVSPEEFVAFVQQDASRY